MQTLSAVAVAVARVVELKVYAFRIEKLVFAEQLLTLVVRA